MDRWDIAITGIGTVCALGSSEAFWRKLEHGSLAIQAMASSQENDPCRWWSPVSEDFRPDLEAADPKQRPRQPARFVQFAMAAGQDAVQVADRELPPTRTAVVMGTTMGGLPELIEAHASYQLNGPHVVPPRLMATVIANMASSHLAMHWGLHGPQMTLAAACASGLDAIGYGAMLIQSGSVDVAIAGGTDSLLDPLVYHSLVRARALARATSAGQASRPFDRHRTGFVMGEGAGVVVLESGATARQRGVPIWGYLRGYGSLADGYHVTAPNPSGQWEAAAMTAALTHANVMPSLIDAVFAHGTGTPVGDAAEIQALNAVFGDRPVPVTSIKGHIGHSMGASGTLSLVAALYAVRDGILPPTVGTSEVDPMAHFALVTGRSRVLRLDRVMVNAFGFGGQNASIIVERP